MQLDEENNSYQQDCYRHQKVNVSQDRFAGLEQCQERLSSAWSRLRAAALLYGFGCAVSTLRKQGSRESTLSAVLHRSELGGRLIIHFFK